MPLAPSTLASLSRALLSARASVSDAWFAANALGDRDSQERLRSANELLSAELTHLEVMMSPITRALFSLGQNSLGKG
jgi:hypothetical protein